MTFSLVVLSCVDLALLASLVAVVLSGRHQVAAREATIAAVQANLDADGYRSLIGLLVVANLTEGGSIRGILTHVYGNAIVLAHPVWLTGARPADIGGEVTIDRATVPMLQRFEDTTQSDAS